MSLYEVLGVTPSASAAEVRRAYLELARQHHPDLDGGDADAMRAVNDAWAILGDPVQRSRYDLEQREPAPARPTDAPPRMRTDEEELLADLADDTPLGGRVVLSGWMSLLPVTTFILSVAAMFLGMVFGSTAALAASVALFMVSCAMFLAAPFVAMLSSRRTNR
jgi:hypothetical protein